MERNVRNVAIIAHVDHGKTSLVNEMLKQGGGRIQTAFAFSDGFGKNWDAFWDVLSKECPASKVTVVGANRLPAAWKNSAGVPFPEMIRRILQRNQEFREKFNEPFDYEFVDA